MSALDRYITGNYGEDQFRDEEPPCHPLHAFRVFLGMEPDEYGGPASPVYQCVDCGDLFAEPGAYCAEPMRTGRCKLDPHHRGRHTTVVFVCDSCDKARRGTPTGRALNPWDGVVEAVFCWLCMNDRSYR